LSSLTPNITLFVCPTTPQSQTALKILWHIKKISPTIAANSLQKRQSAKMDPMQGLDRVPDTNLFIGGIFTLTRKKAFLEANMTHVLTVLSMQEKDPRFEPYKHMQINVDDVEDENLLRHFPAAIAFIEEGLRGGGGVFVHW
jgi:hypothetical protein